MLAAISRRAKVGEGVWRSTPKPVVIEGRGKLRTQVRYVVLNPCRAEIVRDPLEWPWTTHRDVVGAIADPWVPVERIVAELRQTREEHHRFVTDDRTVRIGGTPLPKPCPSREVAEVPLADVVRAALSATRAPAESLRLEGPARNLAVMLAYDQGWRHRGVLARICAISTRSVSRIAARPDEGLLATGRMCLGDRRPLVATTGDLAATLRGRVESATRPSR